MAVRPACPGASEERPRTRAPSLVCGVTMTPAVLPPAPAPPVGRCGSGLDGAGAGVEEPEGRTDGRWFDVADEDEDEELVELLGPVVLELDEPLVELLPVELPDEELLPVDVELLGLLAGVDELEDGDVDGRDGVVGVVGVAVGAGPGRTGGWLVARGWSCREADPGSDCGRSLGLGRGDALLLGRTPADVLIDAGGSPEAADAVAELVETSGWLTRALSPSPSPPSWSATGACGCDCPPKTLLATLPSW